MKAFFEGSVCDITVEYFCLPLWSSLWQVLLHDRWLSTHWPCSISSQPAFHSQWRATNPTSFQKTRSSYSKRKNVIAGDSHGESCFGPGLQVWRIEIPSGQGIQVWFARKIPLTTLLFFSTSDIPFHLVVPLIPFPFCQHGASSLKRLVVAALSPFSSFLCFPSFAFLIFYMQNVNPAVGKSKHGGASFHSISSFCALWHHDQWQWLMLCDVPLWLKY